MAKPEWGVKRQCASCGARFYDLMLDPITCPDCGTVFEVAAMVRGKRPRPSGGRAEAVKKAVLVEEADDLDLDVDLEDSDVDDDDAVLDEDADESDDVEVPGTAAGVDVDDEDDALDTDDSVLIEDDEDDEVPLDEFDAEEEDDDTRR